MTAKYFFDRLIEHEYGSNKERNKWYGVGVCIHRKDEEHSYYSIDIDGSVISYTKNGDRALIGYMKIDDLEGDDFEIYSHLQIIKCGYLKLKNASNPRDVEKIITDLHNFIKMTEDSNNYSPYELSVPKISEECKFINGTTKKFNFFSVFGSFNVSVSTISELCKLNNKRKKCDLYSIPFIKSMSNNNCIRIDFIKSVHTEFEKDKAKENVDKALNELLRYMKDILEVDCDWVECKTNKSIPIYY